MKVGHPEHPHRGEVRGDIGTIFMNDTGQRTGWSRVKTLLAILGPGVIVTEFIGLVLVFGSLLLVPVLGLIIVGPVAMIPFTALTLPGCCCRARPCSCCYSATTRWSWDPGRTRRGSIGFVLFSSMANPADPTRIAGQVATGIGFLGAGVFKAMWEVDRATPEG